jgi:hypothetical protein
MSVGLTHRGLSNTNWNQEEKDITFLVNKEGFKCNRIQAHFLCPKLREIQRNDPSIQVFDLGTNTSREIFMLIFPLIEGKNVEIPQEAFMAVLKLND